MEKKLTNENKNESIKLNNKWKTNWEMKKNMEEKKKNNGNCFNTRNTNLKNFF